MGRRFLPHISSLYGVILCLKVSGMTCGGCVGTIRETFEAIDGVKQVEVSLSNGTARLHSDKEVPKKSLEAAFKKLSSKYQFEKESCAP